MLHITLFISSKGCVFPPAFGCMHIVYYDQLLGAPHTQILYDNTITSFDIGYHAVLSPDLEIRKNKILYNVIWFFFHFSPEGAPVKAKFAANGSVMLLTFLSAIGGFLFGYDTGVVSGAMLLIEEDPRIELDTIWKEIIVSATVRVIHKWRHTSIYSFFFSWNSITYWYKASG